MSDDQLSREQPSRFRAVLTFLLNIVVLPGLGTVATGGAERRKTGFFQLLLMVLVFPALIGGGMAIGVVVFGIDQEAAMQGAKRFLYGLMAINVLFSLKILKDQWKG